MVDYVTNGVAFEATDYKTLKESVLVLLNNESEKKKLLEQQKVFCDKLIKFGPLEAVKKIVEIVNKNVDNNKKDRSTTHA